jgi:predicted RNA-binding protein with PUA-like domain
MVLGATEGEGRSRREEWDGIRNYQARNNMRAMKLGDKGFFYHSNEGLDVVGIVEVCKESIPIRQPTTSAGIASTSRRSATCRIR